MKYSIRHGIHNAYPGGLQTLSHTGVVIWTISTS